MRPHKIIPAAHVSDTSSRPKLGSNAQIFACIYPKVKISFGVRINVYMARIVYQRFAQNIRFSPLEQPPGDVIDALERINQSNQPPAPFVQSVLLLHDGDTLVPENVPSSSFIIGSIA